MLKNPRRQAMIRLLHLEAKFAKDPWLKAEYSTFMKEYLDLGHMKLAPSRTSSYTIPHHAVIKSQNGQMKLRVVFDASCKTINGFLNDHMLTGPKLQADIGDIITNFRTYPVAFTADMVKMYRQVVVNPSDRRYQHILWRFDPSQEVEEYQLTTVTYGLKPSEYLAHRCIRELAQVEGSSFPRAAKIALEDSYVDDIASGANTLQQAIALQEELISFLKRGGFELSKWASNHPELLTNVKQVSPAQSSVSLSNEDDAKKKLLGIQWCPKEDVFSYECHFPAYIPTKRSILSAIARIYDPLGYLSPIIFFAKTIMQETWISKCGWDEPVSQSTSDKWRLFLDQLHHMNSIKIPRCISNEDNTSRTLVGFCDASIKGYSAVLYLRSVNSDCIRTHLVKAKTKLAPLKLMSIPRLELSGALLLSRLFQSCKNLSNKLQIQDARFYTDSQVVLGWLSLSPQRLNAFVAHRVAEILEVTNRNQWYHVLSQDNPSDCSSRGIPPSELPGHPLWWAGPVWLSSSMDKWPTRTSHSIDLPELKKQQIIALVSTDQHPFLSWMQRFSSHSKLLRCTSLVFRYLMKLKGQESITGTITLPEIRKSNNFWIKLVQSNYTSGEPLQKHDALRSLRPFIDGDGLVRVGGRLQHSNLPYDAKHPILIPGDSYFATLLIDHYHRAYLHAGPTSLQAMIHGRYWITSGRKLIRRRVFNCITCYKASRFPLVPLMGDLPSSRVVEGQAFSHVGVDFGGPFYIRESLRRKAALGKVYLCLFVCTATKAVHLEVVSNCSTEAFLAALKRFIGRRGKPSNIFSDCGTNFVGAANRLRDLILLLRSKDSQNSILQYSASREMQWSFNPPAAPHFGGLWEAGIKSCKTILNKVVGSAVLTFEELSTLFCRIEGILNSRPLTPLGSDPDAIDCLTPGHFLIGRPITSLPEPGIPSDICIVKRWKLIQQQSQHFWNRWRLEYLNSLQQRRKWTKETRNLAKNDLVIIKDPNAPQRYWPLARIVETHPGKDGVVRVVTFRTSSGTYKRPVVKLVPLTPINMADSKF